MPQSMTALLLTLCTIALAATLPAMAAPCPGHAEDVNCPPAATPASEREHMQLQPARSQALLTPEERAAHEERIHSLRSHAECTAYLAQHRALLETRAKEKGLELPPLKNSLCDDMKAYGRLP